MNNVETQQCSDTESQYWTFYENGEMINKANNQCLELWKDNATVYHCAGTAQDNRWQTRAGMNLKDNWTQYFTMQDTTRRVLEVAYWDGKGNVGIYTNKGEDD